MINLRLDGVVRTLILTLRARADEQSHDSPLLDDHWSADWYRFMPESEVLDEWYNPAFQLATIIRSRLIDNAVSAFLDQHDDALVIELGAGFSTRYFRVGQGKSRWIELDLDTAIVARRKIDVEVKDHWFLAGDITETDWFEQIPETDPENILFIAEGTLMFAEEDQVKALFKALGKRFGGASIIFDVVNPAYVEHANNNFDTINAPMHWGVTRDELDDYDLSINDTHYLLLEHGERWDALGIDPQKRTEAQSGYVVTATL
ncbi:MAG: class I SAM-dependent methyltransferase [Anaerolineae bacterium]